jgi:hypothetical protein
MCIYLWNTDCGATVGGETTFLNLVDNTHRNEKAGTHHSHREFFQTAPYMHTQLVFRSFSASRKIFVTPMPAA